MTARLRQEASAEAYAARYLALYRDAIADPPPADLAGIARATAAWLEDLLPSSVPRAWQDLAKELAGYEADHRAAELRAMEARLIARLDGLAARPAIDWLRSGYRSAVPLPLRRRIREWRQARS